jgi:hypothetical protein
MKLLEGKDGSINSFLKGFSLETALGLTILLFYSKPFLSFCWEDPKPGLPTTEIDF